MGNRSSSQYLGEHVGGSAVRSLCFVSKMHTFIPDLIATSNVVCEQNEAPVDESPSILISVGAKRVVTAWKQLVQVGNRKLDTLDSKAEQRNGNDLTVSSTATTSSFSFQWLATDMPLKPNSYVKKNNTKKVLEAADHLSTSDGISIKLPDSTYGNFEPNLLEGNLENDWRYLDVTAFVVKVSGSRISTCFTIVACSDATVTARALVLPYRLWFDVAFLYPLSSPVLSLQHVVFPKLLPSKGKKQVGSLYLVIAGTTDGSIAIWDLTECVENFMQQILGLQMEKCMELQKRPRTGRGSQGGRRWRSIDSHNARNKREHCNLTEKDKSDLICVRRESHNKIEKHAVESEISIANKSYTRVLFQEADEAASISGRKDDKSSETVGLVAACVLDGVHQSGVNCLHVSDVENLKLLDSSGLSFYVVSGGDDQAINCFRCDLESPPVKENNQSMALTINFATLAVGMNNDKHHCLIQNHHMQFLYVDKIASAHCSAVKGVWTDGIWIFSVGLDQRVRCWNLNQGKLFEYAHLIISVPEPEALDVKTCGRNHYQIAVAGRGMQMIVFCPENGMSSVG